MFEEELREQLTQARQARAAARACGDRDGDRAYAGRVAGLLRTGAHHGIKLLHEPDEELGES